MNDEYTNRNISEAKVNSNILFQLKPFFLNYLAKKREKRKRNIESQKTSKKFTNKFTREYPNTYIMLSYTYVDKALILV